MGVGRSGMMPAIDQQAYEEGIEMSEKAVRVVHHDPDGPDGGVMTGGMARFEAFNEEGCWVGHVTTEAGVMGGWHHHSENDTYVYVVKGIVEVEFGPGGTEKISAGPGDFAHMPAGLIHREGTAPGDDGEIIVVRVGSGPPVVNVDGPAS